MKYIRAIIVVFAVCCSLIFPSSCSTNEAAGQGTSPSFSSFRLYSSYSLSDRKIIFSVAVCEEFVPNNCYMIYAVKGEYRKFIGSCVLDDTRGFSYGYANSFDTPNGKQEAYFAGKHIECEIPMSFFDEDEGVFSIEIESSTFKGETEMAISYSKRENRIYFSIDEGGVK